MSNYEVLLLGGSLVLVVAIFITFSAAWQDGSVKKGLMAFVLSGILLAAADANSGGGINPGDIQDSFVKLVQYMV